MDLAKAERIFGHKRRQTAVRPGLHICIIAQSLGDRSAAWWHVLWDRSRLSEPDVQAEGDDISRLHSKSGCWVYQNAQLLKSMETFFHRTNHIIGPIKNSPSPKRAS